MLFSDVGYVLAFKQHISRARERGKSLLMGRAKKKKKERKNKTSEILLLDAMLCLSVVTGS